MANGNMMTFQEIADELGMNLRAVMETYNRGMRKLRKNRQAKALMKSLLLKSPR